jgi:hypothetical protein
MRLAIGVGGCITLRTPQDDCGVSELEGRPLAFDEFPGIGAVEERVEWPKEDARGCRGEKDSTLPDLRAIASATLSVRAGCRPVIIAASFSELSIWNGVRIICPYRVSAGLKDVASMLAPIESYGSICSSGVSKLFAPGSIVVEVEGAALESDPYKSVSNDWDRVPPPSGVLS